MALIMVVMVMAMLSLGHGHGHGHFGKTGDEHQMHDHAQSGEHENHDKTNAARTPEK